MSIISTKYRKLWNLIKDKTQPRVRAGFVGQGRHAIANLYPSLAYAGIELVATCATHDADFTNYIEMLDQMQMDCLIACVNAELHYHIASEATSRGLPVFIEKPPAPNSYCAKLLMIEAKSFIMVGFNKRFSPIFLEAKRIIPNPVQMTANVHVGDCKNEETLMMEVGIHYYDLFNWFEVKKRNGVISDNLSWNNATEHIEILGEGHLVVIDNGTLTHYERDRTTIINPNRFVPCKENQMIFTNGYVGELSYFADMVSKKQKGTPSIKDGYKALLQVEQAIS